MQTNGNLWLCQDCVDIAENNDTSSIEHFYQNYAGNRITEIRNNLAELAKQGELVANNDYNTGGGILELSKRQCDCCKSRLYGFRARYNLIRGGE